MARTIPTLWGATLTGISVIVRKPGEENYPEQPGTAMMGPGKMYVREDEAPAILEQLRRVSANETFTDPK